MQKTLTGITATLKGHTITLTATDAEGEESELIVPNDDIHQIYGYGCSRWMEENGDREASLWELWEAVAGISVQDAD